jgi:hypothetical protein
MTSSAAALRRLSHSTLTLFGLSCSVSLPGYQLPYPGDHFEMELAFLFLWALCEPIRIFLGARSILGTHSVGSHAHSIS